jgi:hypothetical protein
MDRKLLRAAILSDVAEACEALDGGANINCSDPSVRASLAARAVCSALPSRCSSGACYRVCSLRRGTGSESCRRWWHGAVP